MTEGTSEKADLISDVIVPTFIIAALIIINAIVFAYIMRQRKRLPKLEDTNFADDDDTAANAIELQRL